MEKERQIGVELTGEEAIAFSRAGEPTDYPQDLWTSVREKVALEASKYPELVEQLSAATHN